MNDTLVFDTLEEAAAACAAIDAKLGYPNPKTKTERYTEPMPGDDGKFYVPTNADCPTSEKNKLPAARKIDPSEVKLEEGKVTEVRGTVLKNGGKLG